MRDERRERTHTGINKVSKREDEDENPAIRPRQRAASVVSPHFLIWWTDLPIKELAPTNHGMNVGLCQSPRVDMGGHVCRGKLLLSVGLGTFVMGFRL